MEDSAEASAVNSAVQGILQPEIYSSYMRQFLKCDAFYGSQGIKVSSSELDLQTFGYACFCVMSLENIMLLTRTSEFRVKISTFNKGKESLKGWRSFKTLGLNS